MISHVSHKHSYATIIVLLISQVYSRKGFFPTNKPQVCAVVRNFFIQRVYVQRIKVNHVKNRRMMYSYSRNSSNFCDVTTSVHRRVSRAASRRLLTKKKKCYGRYGPHLSVEEGKPFLDFIIKAVKQTHK